MDSQIPKLSSWMLRWIFLVWLQENTKWLFTIYSVDGKITTQVWITQKVQKEYNTLWIFAVNDLGKKEMADKMCGVRWTGAQRILVPLELCRPGVRTRDGSQVNQHHLPQNETTRTWYVDNNGMVFLFCHKFILIIIKDQFFSWFFRNLTVYEEQSVLVWLIVGRLIWSKCNEYIFIMKSYFYRNNLNN